jgi:CHAD domain-containing protein
MRGIMKVKSPVTAQELRSEPIWTATRLLLAGQGEDFFSRWGKVTKSYRGEEIHDLRVASRRLREGVALFADLLPVKEGKRLAKGVKRVTRMLGEVRNADEAFLFFSELSRGDNPGCQVELEELMQGLRRERERAHAKLRDEFGALDPEPLREYFEEIQKGVNLFNGSELDPFGNITLFAARAILQRGEQVSELLPEARREENGAAQHRLRIAVKKLRYRLEIIAPLMSRDYQELRGALKGYQDLLGRLHDMDVFIETVQKRLQEGGGRKLLLEILFRKRSRLYSSFEERRGGFPVDSIAAKVRDAL